MSTVSSFRRLLSGRSRRRDQGGQQSAETDGATQSTAHAVAELPGDPGELFASMPPVEASSIDADLEPADYRWETTSRWEDVQKHLLKKAFTTVQSLQQRYLEKPDDNRTYATNSKLELAASKAMALIHQYVDDVRHAVDLPGSDERIGQARLLMRQYRGIETEYIIRLQSSMEETYRKIKPDASEESIMASSGLPRFQQLLALTTIFDSRPAENASHPSPEARNATRTLQILQQSLLDSKKRLTTLGHLWTSLVAEIRPTESTRSSGLSLGISNSATVIAPNGDVVIEYGMPSIYKFRVSSQVLSQSSPFFDYALKPYRPEQMDPRSPPPANMEHELGDTELIRTSLTSPMILRLKSAKHITFEALSIVFYAAHMRIDKVPRQISFQEFVDVASVTHKYRCTAPVELFVERVWLEQWIDCLGRKGYEDFLFISYVFGLERIFEKTSKWAIMQLVSGQYATQEEDSRLPWDAWLHLRAVQTSKLKEILHHCRTTLNSYLLRERDTGYASRPTSYTEADPLANVETLQLKGPTRCIHNSHQCDAANLGWVMLVLNEVGVFPAIVDSSKEEGFLQWQTRSLKSILCKLCAAPSAVGPHGEACDFAPAFRNTMCNIYNGIKGLSIWDVNDRMRSRRGSAISQAGASAFDDAGPSRQDSAPVRNASTRLTSTANDAPLQIINTTSRLSQQSNLNSDGNTSLQTLSDDSTDLTEPDEAPPSSLSRQNLEMLQADFRSVVSTEVEFRTERYPSPTLTTHSVPTARNQLLGLYPPEDGEGGEDGVQGPDPEPNPHSRDDPQERAKIVWNQRILKEVVSRDDKFRILSERHLSVSQRESSSAGEGHGPDRGNDKTEVQSSPSSFTPQGHIGQLL